MANPKNNLKISYVYEFDAGRIQCQSGFPYFMLKQLEQRCGTVTRAFPLPLSHTPRTIVRTATNRLLGRSYGRERDPGLLRRVSEQVDEKIRAQKPDVIFAPSTVPITYLDTNKPIVVSPDAVFGSMLGYYFHSPAPYYRDEGYRQEEAALRNAAFAVFPSDWAAVGAMDQHGAAPDKVKVIPFGANITDPPSDEGVAEAILNRPRHRCRILFMGRDWHRKGGDIVLDVVRRLRAGGLPVDLTIVGAVPPEPCDDSVEVIPNLDKGNPAENHRFRELLMTSHFVFVPSRAEAYGLIFCEACAFGVPAITSAEGGITTIVKHGETGFCLPRGSSAEDFCAVVEDTFRNVERYREIAEAARRDYLQRLNWDAYGEALLRLIS